MAVAVGVWLVVAVAGTEPVALALGVALSSAVGLADALAAGVAVSVGGAEDDAVGLDAGAVGLAVADGPVGVAVASSSAVAVAVWVDVAVAVGVASTGALGVGETVMPFSALFTPATSSLISTAPSPFSSAATQALNGRDPSAMFTLLISSSMVTTPLPSQSAVPTAPAGVIHSTASAQATPHSVRSRASARVIAACRDRPPESMTLAPYQTAARRKSWELP